MQVNFFFIFLLDEMSAINKLLNNASSWNLFNIGRVVTRKSRGRVSFSFLFSCNVAPCFPSSSSIYNVKEFENGLYFLFPSIAAKCTLANIQLMKWDSGKD